MEYQFIDLARKITQDARKITQDALECYYSSQCPRPLSNLERYHGLSEGFEHVLNQCWNNKTFRQEAELYWDQRKGHDAQLGAIQFEFEQKYKKLLDKVTECVIIRPIGSFTGKTHTGHSDLDFLIGVNTIEDVDKQTIPNILLKNGFCEMNQRNLHDAEQRHRVFSNHVMQDGVTVEIEMKIRYYTAYAEMLGMHDYIDNHMSVEDKMAFTYLKVILNKNASIQNVQLYNDLKQLYYCNAGYHARVSKLLYCLR